MVAAARPSLDLGDARDRLRPRVARRRPDPQGPLPRRSAQRPRVSPARRPPRRRRVGASARLEGRQTPARSSSHPASRHLVRRDAGLPAGYRARGSVGARRSSGDRRIPPEPRRPHHDQRARRPGRASSREPVEKRIFGLDEQEGDGEEAAALGADEGRGGGGERHEPDAILRAEHLAEREAGDQAGEARPRTATSCRRPSRARAGARTRKPACGDPGDDQDRSRARAASARPARPRSASRGEGLAHHRRIDAAREDQEPAVDRLDLDRPPPLIGEGVEGVRAGDHAIGEAGEARGARAEAERAKRARGRVRCRNPPQGYMAKIGASRIGTPFSATAAPSAAPLTPGVGRRAHGRPRRSPARLSGRSGARRSRRGRA